MTNFKTIAEKLLTSTDYKDISEVNGDIRNLVELYEGLRKENERLRRKAQLVDDMAKDIADSGDENIIRVLGGGGGE